MSAHVETLHIGLLVGDAGPSDAVAAESTDPLASEQRLEAWFRQHFDMLWRLASRLGVPYANVDDVVQETFITAHRRAGAIVPGAERAFLISTLVKLSANQRRWHRGHAQKTSELGEIATDTANAEHLLAQKELCQLLDAALDGLPMEQRSVLVLFEVEGFTVPEIAALLTLPVGTVASRLGRARTRFGRALVRRRASWPDEG
jgi:RNA polymerase sigma-70 factor (ECF subfamily)